ncbi:MAG: twin-arginine translocation signal domain-containing protein [Gemmatimonadota bacterium]
MNSGTPSRRSFLKTAGVIAGATVAGATATGCGPAASGDSGAHDAGNGAAARVKGFARALLDALADVVLPAALGADGKRGATDAFVAWVDGYDPVAEEMHGYGYADVRYLPPDPAPAWRAQLDGLELLSQRTTGRAFATLDVPARASVVEAALRRERGGDRLPAPLGASHIAVAMLSHWASSPGAWDLALGVQVAPSTCRPLADVVRKPLPVAGVKS